MNFRANGDQFLHVQVFDQDDGSADDFVGECQVPLGPVYQMRQSSNWYNLTRRGGQSAGQIMINIEFSPDGGMGGGMGMGMGMGYQNPMMGGQGMGMGMGGGYGAPGMGMGGPGMGMGGPGMGMGGPGMGMGGYGGMGGPGMGGPGYGGPGMGRGW